LDQLHFIFELFSFRRMNGHNGRSRRRLRNINHINVCVKYTIFFFNFIFWLIGGILVGVALYAFFDKWKGNGYSRILDFERMAVDVSIFMLIIGFIMFTVSFAGCIGALRENSCLLKFYSACLLIFFLAELTVATIGFVFPQTVTSIFEKKLTSKLIKAYRDDADLQNLIDLVQKTFQCCGLSHGPSDWSQNEYFNCTKTNPSSEACAVPFSCCRNANDMNTGLLNVMCGYETQDLPDAEAAKRIWTGGCISAVEHLLYGNLYIIAGVATGVAFAQLFVIFLSRTLEGQIQRQKSLWMH